VIAAIAGKWGGIYLHPVLIGVSPPPNREENLRTVKILSNAKKKASPLSTANTKYKIQATKYTPKPSTPSPISPLFAPCFCR
jgi:hypothetical protein